MKTSDSTIEKIKLFEGLELKAYKPVRSEKYYTIGYGHCGPDVGSHQIINENYATFLLRGDLLKIEKQINQLGLQLNQNQFDALVSFAYNLGVGRLKASTLLKCIREGAETREIQRQFRRWVCAGGNILPGLVKRREWEASKWATE